MPLGAAACKREFNHLIKTDSSSRPVSLQAELFTAGHLPRLHAAKFVLIQRLIGSSH